MALPDLRLPVQAVQSGLALIWIFWWSRQHFGHLTAEQPNCTPCQCPRSIPILDAVECAFAVSQSMEPRTLAEALKRPDADSWISAALAEIEAHVSNGTWELAQLPPGKRAIGSRWVFKVKRKPDGSIDKYKGRIVAQGFSQVRGIHYNEIFASTARMAAMRAVIAMAATEDLELDSVDVSTAFLNGDIDAEIYMKVPEGLGVDGEPAPGEDPKRWVVRLLKGLYGIKQGPRIWSLKLHSVLVGIGFERTDCNHSVYSDFIGNHIGGQCELCLGQGTRLPGARRSLLRQQCLIHRVVFEGIH